PTRHCTRELLRLSARKVIHTEWSFYGTELPLGSLSSAAASRKWRRRWRSVSPSEAESSSCPLPASTAADSVVAMKVLEAGGQFRLLSKRLLVEPHSNHEQSLLAAQLSVFEPFIRTRRFLVHGPAS